MDFFMPERSVDMDDSDMCEFLNSDVLNDTFNKTAHDYINDDWFRMLFDDPVLNDKMITDAAPPPIIQSEHSYSISDQIIDPVGEIKVEYLSPDVECDFFTHNDNALDLSQKSYEASPPFGLKNESSVSVATSPCPKSKTCTPTTIIITMPCEAATYNKSAQTLLPRTRIKVEPVDALDQAITECGLDSIYPPTPPGSSSCSSSDSDGGMSPRHPPTSSPHRHVMFSPSSIHHTTTSLSKPFMPSAFSNPIPTSGVLLLTEEEKRTLVQEGYPVPQKLPLTKSEEKNLKKIRRKIKNKISAQESRRKKKEYLELLEKQVESYTQENTDLRMRVDNLESNNKSLLGQLHKLQSLVGKYTGGSVNSNPTGSMLMVMVLCFALFLGSWAPASLNIGYNVRLSREFEGLPRPNPIHPGPYLGPSIKKVQIDPYSTPNVKSRVLLSTRDECLDEEGYGPRMPMLVQEQCERYEENPPTPNEDDELDPAIMGAEQPLTMVAYVKDAEDVTTEVNSQVADSNASTDDAVTRALMYPDISLPRLANLTATHKTVR